MWERVDSGQWGKGHLSICTPHTDHSDLRWGGGGERRNCWGGGGGMLKGGKLTF